MDIKSALIGFGGKIRSNSPEILAGVGIATAISSVVLAVKATPKAVQLVEARKYEEGVDTLPPKEVIKITWKCYIPTALSLTSSVLSIIFSTRESTRRAAAAMAAYSLAESSLTQYKTKIKEVLSNNKVNEIESAVVKDEVSKSLERQPVPYETGRGTDLIWDQSSGLIFTGSLDGVTKAVNQVNRRMRDELYMSLNDFYDELNIPRTDLGNLVGWDIDHGYLEITPGADLINDKAIITIRYSVGPYRYSR